MESGNEEVSTFQRRLSPLIQERLTRAVPRGPIKKLRAIALSQKEGSPAFLWMPAPAPSWRRWECLSVCLAVNITIRTPTNSAEKFGPHTSAASPQLSSSEGLVLFVPVPPPTGFRFGTEPPSSGRGGVPCESASTTTFSSGC
jgi:hypothetical protein